MDNDDATTGRILSRRDALRLLGVIGLVPLSSLDPAAATDSRAAIGGLSCVVRPAQTVGPYFVDERLNRRDVRSDPATGVARPGAPLDLAINVTRIVNGVCTPFEGAVVDIWHCDAAGTYSDVNDPSFNTLGQKWLRGYQVTDAAGRARFTTIYPGWYQGRTVHIHFKIRTGMGANAGEFVSQLYFDDAYTDRLYAVAPYAGRPARGTRNPNDGIYRNGGSQLTLAVTSASGTHQASFDIGVQL